jgi:hypothetical protein
MPTPNLAAETGVEALQPQRKASVCDAKRHFAETWQENELSITSRSTFGFRFSERRNAVVE